MALVVSDRFARAALAVSLVAHFALQLVSNTTTLIDLRVYRHASPGLLDGSLYEFRLGEFSDQFPLPFTYPPFAALVFLPLAYLPWLVVRFGWQLLSIGCLYWTVRCSLQLVVGRVDRRHALLWTSLALWIEPVRTTLNYGQVNLVLAALLLSAMVAGRDSLAGLGVGLAAGMKLVPAICGVYFLVRRRFVAAAWSGAWFAVSVVLTFMIAPGPSGDYWFHLLGDASRIGPVGSAINQSLRGALARTAGYDVGLGAPWLVAVVLTAALAAWAVRAALGSGDTMAAILAVQLFGLLASPISWSHHWVWVVPALIWLGHGQASHRLAVRASMLFWLLLVGSYLIPLLVVAQPTTWTISRPWYLAASGWAYPVAAVLTLAVIVYTQRQADAKHESKLPPQVDHEVMALVNRSGRAITGDQLAERMPSISRARSMSLAVRPPAEWVEQRKVSVRQRMSISGWWSRASAIAATRSTTAIAAGKLGSLAVRTISSPSRLQPVSPASSAVTWSSVSSSLIRPFFTRPG
jgi:alpha-1,2-mannosyltransferase